MDTTDAVAHNHGPWRNIHVYKLACIAYLGIVVFGYDTGIAGGVVNNAFFQHEFGLVGNNITNLSSNVVSVLQAGAFFGALGSAPVTIWLGRKWSLIMWSAIFCLGAILQTVAQDQYTRGLSFIYAGRVVGGIGVGAISALAPTYVAECCPKDVRGKITGLFQVWVAVGVLLSYWVNYGVALHTPANSPDIWRVPFGVQLVPGGLMCIGLFFCRESPRWLARKGRMDQALSALAHYRRGSIHDEEIKAEMAEIEATILEERESRAGLGWQEAFFGKGNWPRFAIAFVIMTLQQFSGQNTVGYYAPQIFQAIGYVGTTPALLASGVYGVVKVVATFIFITLGVERFGRRWSLFGSAIGMGVLFYIVGAIFITHPPDPKNPNPSPASKGMAAMIYLYCVAYSFGWGPLPWVYVADIFPNRTRHYGLAWASATQWLFNFVISKISLTMETNLQGKIFITFATINIGGMAVFSYFLPETKNRSLEEMDVIFGAVTKEHRAEDIHKAELEMAAGMKGAEMHDEEAAYGASSGAPAATEHRTDAEGEKLHAEGTA
ncbi:general substrate transporter [Calocera cornea HHB12733]|uniref:General substrate transporter n=1 Tax=Calocera cornea HHB12733 TaxID=1353952 RepID=A0A165G4J8_9BASI|nr:general substrate transporter [Calocera cornea HHB12733]